MEGVSIRRWQPDDLRPIGELAQELFGLSYGEVSRLERTVWSGWVAVVNDRVVGFLLARVVVDEMEVGFLGVAPDYRRRGIAKQLVVEALAEAQRRRLRAVFLEVRKSNRSAQRLYQRLGFRLLRIRKDYYPGPPSEDALVLHRSIEPTPTS